MFNFVACAMCITNAFIKKSTKYNNNINYNVNTFYPCVNTRLTRPGKVKCNINNTSRYGFQIKIYIFEFITPHAVSG